MNLDIQKKIQQLKILRSKKEHRNNNYLDYMDWKSYYKQNLMRSKILYRLTHNKEYLKDFEIMDDGLMIRIEGIKVFVCFGGNRSGKTELGAGVVAEYFEKQALAQIMCATVDYKTSVIVQQNKVSKLLRKSNIAYGKYNPATGFTNDMIISKHSAKCIFRTYQQGREAVQGMDLDFIWGDEEMPWDFFQECLARLTDRDGVFLLTFTSLSGFTRLVNFLWESNNKLVESCILSLLDNPFISQKAKNDYLSTVDPDEILSRVEGKPHLKEGLIYKEFNDIHKIKRFDYKLLVKQDSARWKIFEGIDPHDRTPHRWCRFLYDQVNDDLYLVEELVAHREAMLIRDFAKFIHLKRGFIHNGKSESYPEWCQIDTSSMKPDCISRDPNDTQNDFHTVRMEFFKCGITTILVEKDNAVGIDAVKDRLKVVRAPDSGQIMKRPRLYVFDDCTQAIWEFGRYSWDSYSSAALSEKNELINKPLKKDDHIMDIIKYVCIRLKSEVGWSDKIDEIDVEIYKDMGF